MSEEKQENNSPSFFNGLLLGAAVGAGAFFLFGTKKGKKLCSKVAPKFLGTSKKLRKT
jgi:gas vesicle protein